MNASGAASAVGIVPARFAASRFPGKALAEIAGVPMIQRVVESARRARRLREVWVATDDERIAAAARAVDAPVVMTGAHPTGTDRVAAAAAGVRDDIVVNIQGDEPLLEGFVIDAAVAALEADAARPMATVAHAADDGALRDANRVKVVRDLRGNALYFSRSAIPFVRDVRNAKTKSAQLLQHIGLYAYRRNFLLHFVTLPQTPLERAEQLEQLRALEHGFPIHCALIEGWQSCAVDAPQDIPRAEAALRAREV